MTCLGRGEDGAVLAGFADGRIGRVDPANLAVTEIARMPGKVQWVGTTGVAGRPAKPRVVSVVEAMKWVKNDEGERVEVPYSLVHDPDSGKTYDPEARSEIPAGRSATAFLLDSKHRLWLGADNGEWGGWCSCVDLDRGRVHPVAGFNVFGFIELRDGQVWAFGGSDHLGVASGFIARVDTGKAQSLHRLDNGPPIRRQLEEMRKAAGLEPREAKVDPGPEPPFPTDRPFAPVTHVVEDSRTGALVVVSFSDIYRTDARLGRWEKVHHLKIRYRDGRPDAVGTYPSVRSVLPVEGPGQPMGLLFATRVDGLIRLVDGRETSHALPGQLGAEYVDRIEGSAEGVLVFDGSDEDAPWRFRDGAWSTVSFAPPFEKDPREPVVPGFRSRSWSKTRVLVGRDGAIFTINVGPITPGTRTTARWRDGKAEVLGRHASTLEPSSCFLTPDGQIWNADEHQLRRFAGGLWSHASRFLWPPEANLEDNLGIGWGLRTVNEAGPPWIVLDGHNELLLRLTYRRGVQGPALGVIVQTEAGREPRLKVRDAIAWTKGELLLATDRGLRHLRHRRRQAGLAASQHRRPVGLAPGPRRPRPDLAGRRGPGGARGRRPDPPPARRAADARPVEDRSPRRRPGPPRRRHRGDRGARRGLRAGRSPVTMPRVARPSVPPGGRTSERAGIRHGSGGVSPSRDRLALPGGPQRGRGCAPVAPGVGSAWLCSRISADLPGSASAAWSLATRPRAFTTWAGVW